MGLSYFYEFTAPASAKADQLETFLRSVEVKARELGFESTTVLNVPFDTHERREFSYRLGGKLTVRDVRLQGVAIPAPGQVRDYDPILGECRLIAEHAVVLVVTDEYGCESCFGFFQFPEYIQDFQGKVLAEAGLNGAWFFQDFVVSPDPRYRKIVQQFADAGYVISIRDEFGYRP
jgi:hypothetical protein